MKIGIIISSLRMETKAAIRKAKEIGADGIQLWNVGGNLDPKNLTKTGRKDFVDFVQSQGLEISALCGDLGGHGYTDPSDVEWRIERTKEMFDLSLDLGAPIVTTHIGVIPDDENSREWKTMHEAMVELGRYGEQIGACLATETGPEEPALMRRFIESVENEGLKINYDPANLAMQGFDPVAGVHTLGNLIVHTHAKDGLRPDHGGPKEVPLGKGDVPFDEYLGALREFDFKGFLTIEREVGEDPVKDVAEAVQFLRKAV